MIAKRIPELDGLRGVAIILVIIWHYLNNQLVPDKSPVVDFVIHLTSNFWNGVDLFFVLSGFLIGGILLRAKGSENYFKTFYLRRIFRIFPVYYLILFIYIFLIILIPGISAIIPYLFKDPLPVWSYLFYFQNYLMIIKQSYGAGWLGVTWSLAIEEQFYLLLPLLIFLFRKKPLTILIVMLIILATIFRYYAGDGYQRQLAFQCRMDTLFAGVLFAIIFEQQKIISFLRKCKVLLLIILVSMTAGFFILSLMVGWSINVFVYLGYILLFVLLIIFALVFRESFVARILRNKYLRKTGTISYGIYLYHLIVIYLLYWILEKSGVDIYNNLNIILVAAGAFSITYLISYLSYNFFESKLIKIGHKFSY